MWRFCKILWPSQNIGTLWMLLFVSLCFSRKECVCKWWQFNLKGIFFCTFFSLFVLLFNFKIFYVLFTRKMKWNPSFFFQIFIVFWQDDVYQHTCCRNSTKFSKLSKYWPIWSHSMKQKYQCCFLCQAFFYMYVN